MQLPMASGATSMLHVAACIILLALCTSSASADSTGFLSSVMTDPAAGLPPTATDRELSNFGRAMSPKAAAPGPAAYGLVPAIASAPAPDITSDTATVEPATFNPPPVKTPPLAAVQTPPAVVPRSPDPRDGVANAASAGVEVKADGPDASDTAGSSGSTGTSGGDSGGGDRGDTAKGGRG